MTNDKSQEGKVTVAVEKKTSKIPSMVYLSAGLGALAVSACMMFRGRKSAALLVGQWAAPLQNGNTNDLDSRSHNRDNSGMHAGGTEGSSYRPQPDNKEQYGSKKGSYWEEKGSDREQSIGSRMNEESLKQKQ